MPQIAIEDATLVRLQAHAIPLIDTFDTVINRIFDAYEAHNGKGSATTASEPADTTKTYEVASPPNLAFTKVLSAKINGTALAKGANWNGLLKQAVKLAKRHANTSEELTRLVIVNFVPGKKDEDGYEYLPDADISVQGQDANGAWRGISHIAQQLGLSVEVVFLWRQRDKAAFPGQTGRLVVAPSPAR